MKKHKNFIEHIIDQDLRNGLDKNLLKFRFPPEPNGYLHIGHVKAVVLNFELAKEYGAKINAISHFKVVICYNNPKEIL